MTDQEKIALAEKVIARQVKQKAYDRWYLAKQKHELQELRRIVEANELTGEMEEFGKTLEDYIEA
jgi:capsular polysaccharide biosynthesis protein